MKIWEQQVSLPGFSHDPACYRVKQARGYLRGSMFVMPIDNNNTLPLLKQLQRKARACKALPDKDVIVRNG